MKILESINAIIIIIIIIIIISIIIIVVFLLHQLFHCYEYSKEWHQCGGSNGYHNIWFGVNYSKLSYDTLSRNLVYYLCIL